MKHRNAVLSIVFLLIALILIPGCSSNSDLIDIQAERDSLSLKLDNLYLEYQNIQNDYMELSSRQAALEKEKTDLVSENDNLTIELNDLQVQLDDAAKANQVLQEDLTSRQSRYDEAVANFLAANEELSKIKAVYPAKLFATKEDLSAWLKANATTGYDTQDPVQVYKYAADLQQKALKEGYIINVDVSYIIATTPYYRLYCTAQTQDNILYNWDTSNNPNVLINDVTDFRWSTVY